MKSPVVPRVGVGEGGVGQRRRHALVPVTLAAVEPVSAASATVARAGIMVLWPPSSVTVMVMRVGAFLRIDVAAGDGIVPLLSLTRSTDRRVSLVPSPQSIVAVKSPVVARIGVGEGGAGQRRRRALVAVTLAAVEPVRRRVGNRGACR